MSAAEGGSAPVAPGEGRGQLVDHQALRLGLLRGLSGYLIKLCAPGAKACKAHGQLHLGAAAQGVRVHHALQRFTREDEWLDRARLQALTALDQIGGAALNGRGLTPDVHDAWEAGLAADALAWLAATAPDCLGAELPRVAAGVTELIEGGLIAAAGGRAPDVSGRLAAALGLAQAGRWLQRDDWQALARQACTAALDGLSPEGLLLEDHAAAVRAAGVRATGDRAAHGQALASRRQALVPSLVLSVHTALGEVPDGDLGVGLARSLDALLTVRDGLGRKPLDNDAAGHGCSAPYEAASHPFDAHALHLGAATLPAEPHAAHWRRAAGRSAEEWVAHIHAMDGGLDSHHGKGAAPAGCRHLWAAAGAWMARIIEDVALHGAERPGADACLNLVLPDAGLAHLESERWVALLRGAAAPGSCARAGGSLQSLVMRADARMRHGDERVAPRSDALEGQFVRSRRSGLLGFGAGPLHASHLDGAATLHYDATTRTLCFEGGLADAGGTRLEGASTRRTYRARDDGLELRDELHLSGAAAGGRVEYLLPRALEPDEIGGDGATLERRGARLRWRPGGGAATLVVSGRWNLVAPH